MSEIRVLPKYKIAILYIATGRYTIFWEHFYVTAEKNLLNECEKNYFIFTDSGSLLLGEDRKNVTRIEQKKLGWPFDTLMRFEIFLQIKEQLKEYDYIFFFNGNTEIINTVKLNDLLPSDSDQKLVFAHHPHLFHKRKNEFTYDRNPMSLAYIPYGCGKYYFTGALNGGDSASYLEMCEILAKNIRIDLSKDIVALWHDESHLNCYALDRNDVKILPPFFTRGESEYWKKNAKVMFSDKTHYRFGGHAYLRGETDKSISQDEWESKYGKQKQKFKLRFKQYIKSIFI